MPYLDLGLCEDPRASLEMIHVVLIPESLSVSGSSKEQWLEASVQPGVARIESQMLKDGWRACTTDAVISGVRDLSG